MTKEDRQEFNRLEKKINDIEDKISRILSIVKGIAIGIGIGGLIFGLVSIKDLINAFK